jgi:predicted nucleic acid-binding protein
VPALILPEVAATISRTRGAIDQARAFAAALSRLPRLDLVALDTALAQRAADIAAAHRLRGADAVYAAVAHQAGSTLVTLDREQHDRVSGLIATRYPSEAVADLETPTGGDGLHGEQEDA